ncbi:hypothetical protein [Asticcacaulis sp. AND118]|uniref:hypothetical protein n=1 Tax=Asticcacaulis sp. AND118 TaxID=2840468 RepID=UPI001CFF960D|nr:hypothetical protein [Asticcacaulis sp. AND118]UDF02570.1 hypothetical protein LH365_08990 [Asticcacaulis sp. AND118]
MGFKLHTLIVPMAMAVLVSACGQKAPENAEVADYVATNRGYVKSPEVTSVAVTAAGELLVTGSALPESRVRLTSPGGQAYGVTAGGDGRFQASLPQVSGGSLYDLAMEAEGRLMKAEGRLFVPPASDIGAPPRSVLLRPGAAGLPLWPQAGLLAVVDYDAGGAMAVSGRTDPGATVDVEIDGQPAVEVRAGDNGIYTATLPVSGGLRDGTVSVGVHARDRFETRQVSLRQPAGERAALASGVWYVDWQITGGGMQTTVVF